MRIVSNNNQNPSIRISKTGVKKYNPTFNAALLNICAKADTHGYVAREAAFFEVIQKRLDSIFPKSDEKSTFNLFALVGDIFMNPSKKGYKTHPRKTSGDIQAEFLQTSIESIKKLLPQESKFETLYTLGNHDLDGGDTYLMQRLKNLDMKIITTNIDVEKSPMMKELDPHKFIQSKVVEIPDDKNHNMKHHAFFLGITIPSMDFYNPGLLTKMQFVNNCDKKDAQIVASDLTKTFQLMTKRIQKFKKQHPKGAVVVMSHTGTPICEMIRDNVPKINVILNGHDHTSHTLHKVTKGGVGTHITSLGEDNKLFKSLTLHFNDKGEYDTLSTNNYSADATVQDGNPLQKLYNHLLEKDIQPIVEFDGQSAVKALSYGPEIRYKDTDLAKYLTSAVKDSMLNIEPDIDSVAIQSSIIRGGIKPDDTNLALMKVFDGVSEDLSKVKVGFVSGENLIGMIAENIKDNLKKPDRNTIIHWSDIQVNRSLIQDILEQNSDKNICDAIKIRNKQTGRFERIKKDHSYKIAIAEKYLVKNDIKYPSKIRNNFYHIDKTYNDLFFEALERDGNIVNIPDEVLQEQRIL